MSETSKAAALIRDRYPVAGRAVYGNGEPEGEALARAYRYWRGKGRPAVEAVQKAITDSANKASRWPERGLASYGNRPNERGGRWIESPEQAGLRFVGFSDKLASLRHTGHCLLPDGDGGEVARGAVYQLPARDGRPVYVEAVRLGSDGKRGWSEQCGRDGAAIVYLGERHLGERGGDENARSRDCNESAVREAARGADSEAEILAERERDYQEAMEAGRKCGELEAEAAAEKTKARELMGELRTLRRSLDPGTAPKACAALRAVIREGLETMAEKLKEAAELRGHYDSPRVFGSRALHIDLNGEPNELRSAFREGLGNVA